MSGENSDGDYAGAREASAEERAFHAQQSTGGRPEGYEHSGGEAAPQDRGEQPREQHGDPPREQRSEQHGEPRERSEPPREQRDSGTQAPLDLPPPPQSKPFVVWSSSPTAGGTDTRRDD